MSFSLAAVIVLAAVALFLGLIAYNLLSRLDQMERAVMDGGLRAPDRKLTREEYARRFAAAEARADFAAEVGDGVVFILDPDAALTGDIVSTLAHMPQARGFHVALTSGHLDVPDGVATLGPLNDRLVSLGIASTPYCFVISDGTIVAADRIGSVPAARQFLLEVTS